MNWYLTHKGDARARLLADKHYSRQKAGSPQFCPPGNNIVLIVPSDGGAAAAALWVSHRSQPGRGIERRDGFSYWDNPFFRNESGIKSSDLIREALAITRYLWRDALPADGFHSFVDPTKVEGVKVRGEIVHGFVFKKAGFQCWHEVTKERKLLRYIVPLPQLLAIAPQAPLHEQAHMFLMEAV